MDFLRFSDQFYQLGSDFYSEVSPTPLRRAYFLHINESLSQSIGIPKTFWETENALNIFSGHCTIPKQPAIAMVYAGHQFGGYSSQLGDGRALLLAQVKTKEQGVIDLQLKGAGKTPYSRFGDGRAVLRSSIREYLGGEAMHYLGIPTTRSLCLVGSEEPVLREQVETGAIIARTAKTHVRFGHFEYFHYTRQFDQVKKLADYIIQQFIPDAINASDKYQQFFHYTLTKTAKLIAQWQSVGFAHGVMNTDNMSIIGETLDYGPYGFLDDYEPHFICNHSDHTGRYAFDEQPSIGLWNLNALAHALSSLLDTSSIKAILASYEKIITEHFAKLMRQKLGLKTALKTDQSLFANLLALMAKDKVDYTCFFRRLCDFQACDVQAYDFPAMESQAHDKLNDLFTHRKDFGIWCQQYRDRLNQENSDDSERQTFMKTINPKFVARNYLLQQAIVLAEKERDFSEIERLFTLLQSPFAEHSENDYYAQPAPDNGKHLEISCSS